MASEAIIKIDIEVTELGNTVQASVRAVDSLTPTTVHRNRVVLSEDDSVTLQEVTSMVSGEVLGVMIQANGNKVNVSLSTIGIRAGMAAFIPVASITPGDITIAISGGDGSVDITSYGVTLTVP